MSSKLRQLSLSGRHQLAASLDRFVSFGGDVAFAIVLVAIALCVLPLRAEGQSEPPSLPAGLDDGPPTLPSGLGSEDSASEREQDQQEPKRGLLQRMTEPFTGFWEARVGTRLQSDPNQRALSLGETRLQLSRDAYAVGWTARATVDLVYDEVAQSHRLQPEQGRGWLDLRELYAGTALGSAADFRVGRQVLTWGVGDLLFLNDLFPKDWNSFFAGRDVEYLKAPSDAIKLALFSDAVNLDLMYTPKFDPDRFIDNRRLSFFDPGAGQIIGESTAFRPVRPSDWFEDDEVAFRLHRLVSGWELAAYGYRGFWKSPSGFDSNLGRPIFPALSAWGGSIRGPVHTGILSAETAWYRSRDDLDGSDPLLPNSQFRLLVGYEQEIVPDLMLGGQYYLERTLDYGALKRNQPMHSVAPDETRHLFTLRLTLLTHSQNVTWSLFTFASPSDKDGYLRGSWNWKATDQWTLASGFNVFDGERESSFFGQFERNSNAWASIRFGF